MCCLFYLLVHLSHFRTKLVGCARNDEKTQWQIFSCWHHLKTSTHLEKRKTWSLLVFGTKMVLNSDRNLLVYTLKCIDTVCWSKRAQLIIQANLTVISIAACWVNTVLRVGKKHAWSANFNFIIYYNYGDEMVGSKLMIQYFTQTFNY